MAVKASLYFFSMENNQIYIIIFNIELLKIGAVEC